MIYNYQSAPLNKNVYCVGFRCGTSAIPSVNCHPTLGIVKMCKDYGATENLFPKIIHFISAFMKKCRMILYIILQTPMRKQ